MKANAKTEQRDGRNLRHQSAVGLLLLTLLMANPLQGFATAGYGVISTGSTTGTNLNLGFDPGTNYVLVTNGITITGTSNAVFGDTHAWYLTNAATLSGNTNGVYLGSGGSVNNLTNGTISGIVNDGVAIVGGGSVNNLTGGFILGNTNGVYITNGIGSVVNAGVIRGTNGSGVYMDANTTNGSVNNQSGGTIAGVVGVNINSPGYVTNAGAIAGTAGAGVYIGSAGGVNNLSGGTIVGNTWYGVIINGTGYVTNAGTITGSGVDGVYIGSSGTVNNSGNIYGNTNGASIYGSMGSVVNAGSITGTNGNGVYMGAGGSVNNQGNISGGKYGVFITNGTGSVINTGSIAGNTNDGVYLGGGGSVNNAQFIYGNTNGVSITGSTGSVVNTGIIIGLNGAGVYLGTNGSVNNQSGIIEGGQYGVEITNGMASVTNAGTIAGYGNTAISTAILLGNYSNTVVLQTGSLVKGNIVGGTNFDAAVLQGHGSYGSNFVNFETLTVQGDSIANVSSAGWNLTGTNTFSTNVTVQTGLLSINGGLTTPLVTVSSGSVLGGSGTINGTVNDHGIISPGNSIGTLNIVGALNMTNAYYWEEVSNVAGRSDLINVTGTAIISNATVVVIPTARQIYGSNTVYTNLTATGGVFGTNANIIIQPTFSPYTALFLTPSLQYLTNTLGTTNTTVTMTLKRKSFTTVANTYNQHSVAGALDGIVDSSGAMSNLVNEFFWLPSASAAQSALDSLSGAIHGSLGMLDVQQQDAFNNSIALRTGRISAGGSSGGYTAAKPVQLASAGSTLPPMQQSEADQLLGNIWLQGFGTFGHLDGDGNALGGDFTISGTSGGLDYRLSPEMLVGLAVGYSHNDASVGGPGASGSVDAIQFAGYGGYVSGPWHLDGIFSYGYLQTDTKRIISVGSINQEADGSYDGNVFSLSTEGGYAFEAGPLTIEPTLGLNYTHLSQDSFSETGAGVYGLNVNSVDMDSFRSAVGVRLAAKFGEKDDVQFIPELRAGWEHEFMDKTADVNASFIGGSGNFVVRGVELGADSGVLGAGLTVWFNKEIQGFVNYDARMNERISSHTISGGLSYSW